MNERWFGPVLGAVVIALAMGVLFFVATGMGGLSNNLVYYWSPTELIGAGETAYAATVRLGGIVEAGSKEWDPDNNTLDFRLSDGVTNFLRDLRGIRNVVDVAELVRTS